MNPELNQLICEWLDAVAAAEAVKPVVKAELELRKKLFAVIFDHPQEGINRFELGNGYSLVAGYPLKRAIDKPAYEVLQKHFTEQGIPSDLVVNDPKLDLKKYRKLTDEQRQLFDACLIIKPESVTLNLEVPKND